MACFGGGGGAKNATNTTTDPQIATKPFLEVKLCLGNANTREAVVLLNSRGDYLPGSTSDSSGHANRPPKQPKLPAGKKKKKQ